ncbi:MAG: septum formation initiator family protein [Candidatus Paceibacterota bacterium]|jgi:cell division protein FtsB
MRFIKPIIILIVVAVLGYGIYGLMREKSAIEKEMEQLADSAQKLNAENAIYQAKIMQYKRPENLLKLSREQFNYKREGEKMIIVVPGNASTSSSTAR